MIILVVCIIVGYIIILGVCITVRCKILVVDDELMLSVLRCQLTY